MITDLFVISAMWFVLSCFMTLLLGTRWRQGGFFVSLLYLVLLIAAGDVIALPLVKAPLEIIVASMIALGLGVPFILILENWNAPGQTFLLCATIATVVYLAYAFAVTAFSPLSPIAFVFSFLLFVLEVCALTLSLTYAFEVLDVLCRIRWNRRAQSKTLGAYVPMVSLHVPAYNEPPELVEQTLRALAELDYPYYEVILVDNNTPAEEIWQPLAKLCREFGFKCLHLERWPGYKSGALNFALAVTDPRAEIIGVIDADYIVQPDYLRRIVPYFEDPQIAFVQTPQDYRNTQENGFFQAAYDGYKYFFALSMLARNERNAIIFCGTMGLLRHKVLQQIGGWDEWCITEDAEASLRILNRGYRSLYVNETFGRGLMPLDFEGLKKQRFRWAFGGIQILKKHWGKLMPWAHWIDPANRLSGSQRYFYLISGLQWFNELFTFAFTIFVLISAFLTITGQTAFLRPASEAFVILPLVLIGTNLLRATWGLRHALSVSWGRALGALTLWFSLTWVVALACVQAIVRQRGVFLRTPKSSTQAAWARALQTTSWETTLGVACIVGGVGALVRAPSWLSLGLLILCLAQATIYLSAPMHSLQSLTNSGLGEPDRGQIRGIYANESRLGLQLALAAVVVLAVASVAALWPAPSHAPVYSSLAPQPVIIPQDLPPIQQNSGGPAAASATPRVTVPGTPTAMPRTSPSPTPLSNPSLTPLAKPSLTFTPQPTSSPRPTPTITPNASPQPSATPSPSTSPTPSPSPTPTATP